MIYKFKEYNKTEIIRGHLNLGGENPDKERIDVNNLYFERGAKPWLAAMGEIHFSRCSRDEWYRELCKMRAGGITIAATYLFWNYHEEEEGIFDFSGDRDIRGFIIDCQRAGLDVVLRVGPWAHGECRNGGFPDWLIKKPYKLRDNNSEYLAKVKIWFDKIYEQTRGLYYKDGGNIIAVQLENEFTDNAEHLKVLKQMAIAAGIEAPLYTVTGWNRKSGAMIPVDEVVPVFGGYAEAPWENHIKKLDPSPHYFFNKMRNDSAIGTDLLAESDSSDWQLPYEKYPFATCELGGGIQITHHRRPIMSGMDIYAVSLVKLGSGNNLIGYYMYHGGTNKIGKLSTLNESRATGYPNDYPILSYDFQAPLSEYGEVREQYRLLNLLHMFVNDFGSILAPMDAVDAQIQIERNDTNSLRYGMRTNGTSGYVFVNHYQRLCSLADVTDAVIDTGEVKFPPIDICGDISFFMPFNMNLSGTVLEYATAQPLCRIDNTYFFAAIDGIKPVYRFKKAGQFEPDTGIDSAFSVAGISVITLSFDEARYARKLSGKMYIGIDCDIYECDGEISCVQEGSYAYYVMDNGEFRKICVNADFCEPKIKLEKLADAPIESEYIDELRIGGEREISWYRLSVDGAQGFVEINVPCDAAQIYIDGRFSADEYYYGVPWRIPAKMLYNKECYLALSEMRDDFYREF